MCIRDRTLAVLADNLGVLWVAIEATTITTAFLVGYRSGRRSLEAAWKYVCLLYTSPSPRDRTRSRMPSSA